MPGSCSILAVAESQGLDGNPLAFNSLHRLTLPEERRLCKHLTEYPEEVHQAAAKLEPHRMTPFYLGELAGQFHHYYNHHRIIQEDQELSQARSCWP